MGVLHPRSRRASAWRRPPLEAAPLSQLFITAVEADVEGGQGYGHRSLVARKTFPPYLVAALPPM
jgi:hypothetical protein